MHLIRRAAFRAATAPALAAQSRFISTRITASPFRIQAAQSAPKLTSIAFRRFASDDADAKAAAEAEEEGSAAEPVDADAGEQLHPHDNFSRDAPPPMRSSRPEMPPNNSIYVGNLQFDVTEADLRREFEEFGEVKNVLLATEPRGLSKGFGYVEFATIDSATAAIQGRNQTVLEGRRMIVNYQGKSTRTTMLKNPPSRTLFIGNLAFEMSDADLNKLFRDIRNVVDVRVAIDRRTGQPRGFAHADFTDVASAEKALEYLQNKEVYGRLLRIDYSAAKTPRLGDGDSPGRGAGRGAVGEFGNSNGRPSF